MKNIMKYFVIGNLILSFFIVIVYIPLTVLENVDYFQSVYNPTPIELTLKYMIGYSLVLVSTGVCIFLYVIGSNWNQNRHG